MNINDILLAIGPSIVIFFASSKFNIKNQLNIRDFLMGLWVLIIVMFLFSNKYAILSNIKIYWAISIIVLFLKSINEMYITDELEKFLNIIQLGIYSTSKIIFYTRYYIIFVTLFLVQICQRLKDNYYLCIVILLIGSIYHIISQSKNCFYCDSFEVLKEKLKIECNYKLIKDESSFFELECVKFFLFVEDRYFMEREKIYSTIVILLKHKIKSLNIKIRSIKKGNIIKKCNYVRRYKSVNLIRGYSNIEQQLVRTQCMSNNSYKYQYRRKIFVEYIYTTLFFNAVMNQNKQYNRYNLLVLKKQIIESYFKVIYKLSMNDGISIEKLIPKMQTQSKQDIKGLYYIFINNKKLNG